MIKLRWNQRTITAKSGPSMQTIGFMVVAIVVAFTGSSQGAILVTFEDAKLGEVPAEWMAGVTGKGSPHWEVVIDESAPSKPKVLAQTGEGTFPFCVLKNAALTNGFVETKFKAVSGKEDQAGGLIWRFKDKDNYYVARANALEDNVTIYHTIAGKRTEKKRAHVKVTPQTWHTLRVDFEGQRFRVTFDGKLALEWQDETFRDAGAVGMWTKADSHTLFDDFTYEGK